MPEPPRLVRRRRLRRLTLALIGLLYVASIPWYRETGAEPAIVLGLPDWVATALACYVGVALLNSVAWWLTEIDDAGPVPGERPGEGSPR
jgi:hypothetical protein